MLSMLFEFTAVFLFFIAFKWYGIYVATVVGITTSALQFFLTYLFKRVWDKKQGLVLLIFLVFGGMTLYFHNPIFVKWKPSVIFWIFGIVFLGSQFFGEKPLAQRMMGAALEEKTPLPAVLWKKLNMAWVIFFIGLGSLNIFVAYHFSTNTWVNFKLYGIFSAMLLFCFAQTFYISHFLARESKS